MVSAMNKKTLTLLAAALTVATFLTAATAFAAEDNQQPGVSQTVADGHQLSSEALLRLKLKRKLRIPQPPTEPPPDLNNPNRPDPTYPQTKVKFLPRRMAR